jgi:hypothetical protein
MKFKRITIKLFSSDIYSSFVKFFISKGLLFKDSKEIIGLALILYNSRAKLLSNVDWKRYLCTNVIEVRGTSTILLESIMLWVISLELHLSLHVIRVALFHIFLLCLTLNEVVQVKHIF